MLTIGQISNLAKISNRTIRHYESLGLLKPIQRGNNNYRYYKRDVLAVLDRIRDLQSLGFKLDEIRQILPVKPEDIYSWLSGKLAQVDQEFALLGVRRQRLEHLLSTLKPGVQNRPLNQDERKMLMETVKEHAIVGLKKKKCIDVSHSRLLEREVSNYDGDDQRKFFDAIRSCVEFARSRDLILGPGRGYASSSMLLFGLGLTAIDPVADQLVPERMVAHMAAQKSAGWWPELTMWCPVPTSSSML
jgi:DNA-binding transcriptional MerR regulator